MTLFQFLRKFVLIAQEIDDFLGIQRREVNKADSFPNWFKNILIGIGVLTVFEIVRDSLASHVPFIALCYPIILLIIWFFEKYPDQRDQIWNGTFFFNISISIIAFFTLILLVDYKVYVECAGTLTIGKSKFHLTENPVLKVAIYVAVLIYFLVAGGFLSYRIKLLVEYNAGIAAFKLGKKLWGDSKSINTGHQSMPIESEKEIKDQKEEVLKYFDIAIEKKCPGAEVFAFRGTCLFDLGFYFEALEDYDKAINSNPRTDIAFNYYMRSNIKNKLFDYEGSLADIEKAISIAKLDTEDNTYWNEKTRKKLGFNSATEFYDWHLFTIKQHIRLQELSPKDRTIELQNIKRRKP